jgi:PII-like signaling protein
LILSESRRHDHQPLFRKLLDILRAEGLAGTTLLKGIAGFGHDRQVHTIDIEVASVGLPVIIERVDTQEHIDRVLPKVEGRDHDGTRAALFGFAGFHNTAMRVAPGTISFSSSSRLAPSVPLAFAPWCHCGSPVGLH